MSTTNKCRVIQKCTNDRPITAITVVEDWLRCPKDFIPIPKTDDMDLDADLWRDNSFFAKKITRYLCISKEKSIADYVLEDVKILSDKEFPPEGYGTISKTTDTDQKAWRKKQLCFKLSRPNVCHAVITDLILLNNNKIRKAPEGFHLKGDLNGLLLCVKLRPTASVLNNTAQPVNCNGHTTEHNGTGNEMKADGESHDYEKLIMKPVRPAPMTPNSSSNSSYQGLQGVPFMLNSRLEATTKTLLASLPEIIIKTKEDIDKEYSYDFRTEKQLCLF